MNNLVLQNESGQLFTTSRIVADYFGKSHFKVMEKIECLKKVGEFGFELSYFLSEQNKNLPIYTMTKKGFFELAMTYSGEMARGLRAKFFDAFDELEHKYNQVLANPVLPTNFVESLQMLLESEKQKQLLLGKIEDTEQERDHAIKSKSWISSSREASVMGQLSQSKRKLLKLEEENQLLTVEHVFNPSDIGERVGLTAKKINNLLLDHGYQTRARNNRGEWVYTSTDLGKKYARLVIAPGTNGGSFECLRWSLRILPVIETLLALVGE